MIFLGIFGSLIVMMMLIGTIAHATYFRTKLENIKPYGQMVEVYDGQMHVYSLGSGEKTIVILPGMGVALPSSDFGPLMRKLSERYTVVLVEYFGVGFSSETSRPRTSENYVEEIRSALTQAGVNSPYVLMAHSISSVFSEYYAAKYPDEVEAVISLDGTTTALYGEMPSLVKYVLPIAKFQQGLGTTSVIALLSANKSKLLLSGYTEKEINDAITFAGFSMNNTVLAQIANSAEFIKQTMVLPFPEKIPYFKVISKQTYEQPNAQLKQFNLTPQEYQTQHLNRIGGQAKYEILDGSHFIYLNNVDRIAEITDEVLQLSE